MIKNDRMEGTLKNMKWKWIMEQMKKEKDEAMKKNLWIRKGIHATWSRGTPR